MSKKANQQESSAHAPSISKKSYKGSLHKLQIERVKLHNLVIPHYTYASDFRLIIGTDVK